MYYVVQPYISGPDRGRKATIISTHETVEAAFEALDGIANRLQGHGLAGDVIELLVVDEPRRFEASMRRATKVWVNTWDTRQLRYCICLIYNV
jgi:hypothetical protein